MIILNITKLYRHSTSRSRYLFLWSRSGFLRVFTYTESQGRHCWLWLSGWHGCGMYVYYDVKLWHISDISIWLIYWVIITLPGLYLLSSSITFHSNLQTVTNQAATGAEMLLLMVIFYWEYSGLREVYLTQHNRAKMISDSDGNSVIVILEYFLCQTSVHLLLIMTDR